MINKKIEKNKFQFIPNHFGFQLFVTDRCNLDCIHCYQNSTHKDLTISQIEYIIKNYLSLKNLLESKGCEDFSITLLGGEPFISEDIFRILEEINSLCEVPVEIVTNGTLITEEIVKELSLYNIGGVHVSLDGLKRNNNVIRGKNTFSKIINSIKILKKFNFKTTVTFTLHKKNKEDLPELLKKCENLNVDTVIIKRLLSIDSKSMQDLLLTPDEFKQICYFVEEDVNSEKEIDISFSCEGGIYLQEKKEHDIGFVDNCMLLFQGHMTVDSDGTIYPCRRLPIKLGNALDDNLSDIFFYNKKFNNLRNLNNLSEVCGNCSNFEKCLSGARCQAYNYFNDLYAPDPHCWKLFESFPSKDQTFKTNSNYGRRIHPSFLTNFVKSKTEVVSKKRDRENSAGDRKLNINSIVKKNDDIPYVIENGKVFTLDLEGNIMKLNETASFLWKCCENKSIKKIIEETKSEFDVNSRKIKSDIFKLFRSWSLNNLIELK